MVAAATYLVSLFYSDILSPPWSVATNGLVAIKATRHAASKGPGQQVHTPWAPNINTSRTYIAAMPHEDHPTYVKVNGSRQDSCVYAAL